MKKDESLEKAVRYIRSWLPFRFERSRQPGMVVGIAQNGEQIYLEAFGQANIERREPMTAKHAFRIASHSKTFTATAVLMLQEQGKLKLDDVAAQYVSWLKEHSDKRWGKVTIRQLLSHSAGVIRDGEDSDYWNVEKGFPEETELKSEMLKSKLIYDTNTRQKYSNYGYSVLGEVIEAASGQSYNEFVTDHILRDLGLESTLPEYQGSTLTYATGYSREEPKDRMALPQIDTRAMSAATGFCSTAGDVCQYFSAHFVGSNKLLDDESKKEMQRTQSISRTPDGSPDEYGLGFSMYLIDKHRLFGHGGGFPGFITKTMCDPEKEIVVTVLTNAIDGNAEEIARGIWTVIYKFLDAGDVKAEHDLTKFEGRFRSLWSTADIINVGDKLYEIDPTHWNPFSYPLELKYVDTKTLKYEYAYMGQSPGELVKYNEDGSIRAAGATMLTEKQYHKQLEEKKPRVKN
jgi:D-alanyl-D-alanine carboxypeptidase